jgi:hypothetical protein
MSYTIEWLSNGTNIWPINTAVTTSTNLIEPNLYNGQVYGYSLPAGNYTYSATTTNSSNYYNEFQLLDRSGRLLATLVSSTNPWSSQGPFTGSFTLPFQTTVYARMVDYYMYSTRLTLTLTNTPLSIVSWSKLGTSGTLSFSNLRTTIGVGDSNLASLRYYGLQISYPGTVAMSNFYNNGPSLKPGFTYRVFRQGYYAGVFTTGYYADDPMWFSTRTEQYMGTVTDMSTINTSTGGVVPTDSSWESYSVEWFGYFYATVTGTYTFYTVSDDASYIWVGSNALYGYTTANCIVNNGGGHGRTERSGTINLTANTFYPIRSQFGEGGGGDNFDLSFSAPGIGRTYNMNGYVFYPLGTTAAFPAESARILKTTSKTNVDGVYYINVNGTGTATYCLMDNKWNGGGWMMLMKATRGTTFNYNSSYWTDTNTTLNPSSTNRSDGDAKFNIMNYAMIKDVMALWPDTGYTGGSISGADTWSWMVNNWYSNGDRCTPITGFSNSRDSPTSSDPTTFSGFTTSIWSTQTPSKRHIFGGGSHIGTVNSNFRWGFIFNENAPGDFSSSDVGGGIGMSIPYGSGMNYSAGDAITCCQSTTGLNRSMRVELYGR